MAIVATLKSASPTFKCWELTALDADTAVNVAHGFGVIPQAYWITPCGAALAAGASGLWSTGVADATNIPVNKLNSAGSGGAVPGTTVVARLVALLPHSLI